MNGFVRHAALLFFALRIGDFVNAAAGMWFVPKYVKPEDIGAVLPVTSFATFLSLPVFAFAMTVMKETACLAAAREYGKIKTLLCGVFWVVAIAMGAVLGISAVLMPHFLDVMRISDGTVGFLVVSAAFLGCAAPVYTDALQSLKRFKSLAVIEAGGTIVRFLVMFVMMPVKALAGYFAGQAALPVFRIAGSVVALRRNLSVRPKPFWNREEALQMMLAFATILAYQAIPMAASLVEQTLLRTSLPSVDSAGYYMVSRFADFLHYLTFPLLLVMFPYTATAAQKGASTCPYVIKCSAVTLAVSMLMAAVYSFWGAELLSLMPNGKDYASYAQYMPWLVLSNAFTACQVFYANSEVSAGRFAFMKWFVPLHLVYMGGLIVFCKLSDSFPLALIIICLFGVSLFRFVFSAIAAVAAEKCCRTR